MPKNTSKVNSVAKRKKSGLSKGKLAKSEVAGDRLKWHQRLKRHQPHHSKIRIGSGWLIKLLRLIKLLIGRSLWRGNFLKRSLLWLALLGLIGYGSLWGVVSVLHGLSGPLPLHLEVQKGDSLSKISARYVKQGQMPYPDWVRGWARLHGSDRRLKAGNYVFDQHPTVRSLVKRMAQGQVELVRITIPEGFSLKEIAFELANKSIADSDHFLKLAYDADFIASLKLPFSENPPSLEGLLLPETYHFAIGNQAALVLRVMHREFMRQASFIFEQTALNKLNPYQVVVLASIVEKETGSAKERPLVASVFHNRLRKNFRLETDPTVIYGLSNFDGNITRAHLRAPTPYNTYLIKGLPPTPIANPGLASLRAVLAPAESEYLYFVAKGDGTHFFSKDYGTHTKAVYRYQIKRRHKSSRKK